MQNNSQCRVCKYFKIKKTIFGGTKTTCSMHNCKTSEQNGCQEFEVDANKILYYARFRKHEYGSKDSCSRCAHRDGKNLKSGIVYSCQRNDVQFWDGFSPMEYICDNFKDGGMDALVDHLACLILDSKQSNKEGE